MNENKAVIPLQQGELSGKKGTKDCLASLWLPLWVGWWIPRGDGIIAYTKTLSSVSPNVCPLLPREILLWVTGGKGNLHFLLYSQSYFFPHLFSSGNFCRRRHQGGNFMEKKINPKKAEPGGETYLSPYVQAWKENVSSVQLEFNMDFFYLFWSTSPDGCYSGATANEIPAQDSDWAVETGPPPRVPSAVFSRRTRLAKEWHNTLWMCGDFGQPWNMLVRATTKSCVTMFKCTSGDKCQSALDVLMANRRKMPVPSKKEPQWPPVHWCKLKNSAWTSFTGYCKVSEMPLKTNLPRECQKTEKKNPQHFW